MFPVLGEMMEFVYEKWVAQPPHRYDSTPVANLLRVGDYPSGRVWAFLENQWNSEFVAWFSQNAC